MENVDEFKPRLDALLERLHLSHRDIWQGIGMTESGYYRMWKRGSIDLRTILKIADVLKVDPGSLLSGRSVAERSMPPVPVVYIEERISALEQKVRKLETTLKPQTK